MENSHIVPATNWTTYELIDSGEGAKLERFDSYVIDRPDPRALWQRANKNLWDKADARYIRTDAQSGHWDIKKQPPTNWTISYKQLVFTLKPTSFKHVGVFPEQSANWDWIMGQTQMKGAKVLNLFGYTGGATMAAIAAGAHVTHVDSAKSAITWAKENMTASHLPQDQVRWIVEDAYKFVLREGRRGNHYDAIFLDPPRFGRGSQGEVWKLEDDLPKLLSACRALLSPSPIALLINCYTADLSCVVLGRLMTDMVSNLSGTRHAFELALQQSTNKQLLPSGICARWANAA